MPTAVWPLGVGISVARLAKAMRRTAQFAAVVVTLGVFSAVVLPDVFATGVAVESMGEPGRCPLIRHDSALMSAVPPTVTVTDVPPSEPSAIFQNVAALIVPKLSLVAGDETDHPAGVEIDT